MQDIINPENGDDAFYERMDELGWDELLVVGDDATIVQDKSDLQSAHAQYDYVLVPENWGCDDARVDMVVDLETSDREDHTHYRRSGMTQVHAKQAKENDVAVAFDLRLLFTELRDIYMGRMMQNVRICSKYEVPMRIVSMAEEPEQMRHAKDMQALGRVLGMTDEEARGCVVAMGGN